MAVVRDVTRSALICARLVISASVIPSRVSAGTRRSTWSRPGWPPHGHRARPGRAGDLPRQPQRAQPRLDDPRAPRWSESFRTRNKYSATSVDQLPAPRWPPTLMYGHQLMLPGARHRPHPTTSWSLGANPMASNGSLMTAPRTSRPGCAPSRPATAGWWCSTRVAARPPEQADTSTTSCAPGTDALVLAGDAAGALLDEGLHPDCPGVRFRRARPPSAKAVRPFTPERAADRERAGRRRGPWGWPVQLAASRSRPPSTAGSGSPPRSSAWSRPGAGAAAEPGHRQPGPARGARCSPARRSTRSAGAWSGKGHHDVWRSRVRGHCPSSAGELPSQPRWPTRSSPPGEGQDEGAAHGSRGNPVSSTPDGTSAGHGDRRAQARRGRRPPTSTRPPGTPT